MRLGHNFHTCKFAHPAPNPPTATVTIYKKKESHIEKDPVPVMTRILEGNTCHH